jgi:uncharacterized protein (TIGR00369 family)
MDYNPFTLDVPFLKLIGIEPVSIERDKVVGRVTPRAELMNSWGSAHGGVVMTALDCIMSIAARTAHRHDGGALTVEMKTSFIGAAVGPFTVEGRLLHGGKSLQFCEAEARDEQGKLLAKALGTFKLLEKR